VYDGVGQTDGQTEQNYDFQGQDRASTFIAASRGKKNWF